MYSEKTPDDGQRDCPKHVEFYSKEKNKFEKLVRLIGFIISIYYCIRNKMKIIGYVVFLASQHHCIEALYSGTSDALLALPSLEYTFCVVLTVTELRRPFCYWFLWPSVVM